MCDGVGGLSCGGGSAGGRVWVVGGDGEIVFVEFGLFGFVAVFSFRQYENLCERGILVEGVPVTDIVVFAVIGHVLRWRGRSCYGTPMGEYDRCVTL